jgi:preprotein translocase subunit YajC
MLFAAATTSNKSSSPTFFIILIVAYAAIYFFYLRPRSKRAKAARQQARQVEIGDEVRTIGGLIGTVVSRDDDSVTLRTTSVELDFIPSAIAGQHTTSAPATTDDPSTNEGDAQ